MTGSAHILEPPTTVLDIRRQARLYPAFLLPAGGSALSLFSAGFWGWNDAVHLADAGMTTACVDTDQDRLWEMVPLYPQGWSFYAQDVWEFARDHAGSERWDVVTVDPWVPMMDRVLDDLPLWCGLARSLVTVGCLLAADLPAIPEGWRSSTFPRNERVGWLVLQR